MFERTVLSNGLKVLTAFMPHTRSVSIGFFVATGSRYEDDELAGASHLLEHVLFKGSAKRPEPQLISGAIESVGGVLNASTDREATIYYAKVGRDHFGLALDVLADMVTDPVFDDDEIDRERRVVIEEISMTYDQPDALADILMDEALWPEHAMGRDIAGTKESVMNIPKDGLVGYFNQQYCPKNVVLAVAGSVTHDQVTQAAESLLGSWAGGLPLTSKPFSPIPGVRIKLASRDTDQAHLCLAVDGVKNTAQDRYAFDMLNAILGEGMTSRLFLEVRERRGLAYEVHSSSIHYRDCGALVVYCGVDASKVDGAIEAILGEFGKLRESVPAADLSKSVEYAVGRLDLRLEDTRAVMGWIGGQELMKGNVLTPENVVTDLRAVTAGEVAEAAVRYLNPNGYRLAVVGPFSSDDIFRRAIGA